MISLSSSAKLEESWSEEWIKLCDRIAATGKVGAFVSNRCLRLLTINAPVIISFVTICALLQLCTGWMGDTAGRVLGVHDTWNSFRLLQYTSLVTHIFAHSGFNHLRGNVTHLLLVGPSVEHEFGSKNLLIIMAVVAIVSAFVHIFVGNWRSHQLGASGVVFACILLNSLVSADNGRVPVSFLLIALLYLGDELLLFFNFWNPDGVSHHAHLSGGLVGAAAGFYIHRTRRQAKTKNTVQKWLMSGMKNKKK
jgi:membrane associated rhomboid family serine protease